MKINRYETLTEAGPGPCIEVRCEGDGYYLLRRALTEGESLRSGPFPTANIAENEGVSEAERRGVKILNIVHSN